MAWVLSIYTIDVGQGESALVIAEDATTGGHRTMLIDGGLAGYAGIVHGFIDPILTGRGFGLDHILVSHYDEDHSAGVIGLLMADDMRAVVEVISDAIGAEVFASLGRGENHEKQVACGALACAATIFGAYGANGAQVAAMCIAMAPNVPGGATDTQAANYGYQWAVNHTQTPLSNRLYVGKTRRIKQICLFGSVPAVAAVGGGLAAATAGAFTGVFAWVRSTVPTNFQFDTGGRYRTVHLLDIGTTNEPQPYAQAVIGRYVTSQGDGMIAPIAPRNRTTPALEDEILWNSGGGAGPAPQNSPAIFTLAINRDIWQGIGRAPVQIGGGQPGNDVSIGLIIRFGNFYFYTGGDLPSTGEDLLATAVMARALPNPQGGTFAAPALIAAFKAGHHGSSHSTSAAFLNTTQAVASMISCGQNQFGPENHPSQATINRLHGQAAIAAFYLTNCNYVTNFVPASNGQDELIFPGNKSRVSGQNDVWNLAVGRNRGNIELSLTQAQSTGNGVVQAFSVTYYEDDNVMAAPIGLRAEVTPF